MLIERAFAQNSLSVNIGPTGGFYDFAEKAINVLATTAGTVVTAIFIIGAFMYLLSGVKEDLRDRGKNVMIGSLIGLVVILSAFVILRIVFGIFVAA